MALRQEKLGRHTAADVTAIDLNERRLMHRVIAAGTEPF